MRLQIYIFFLSPDTGSSALQQYHNTAVSRVMARKVVAELGRMVVRPEHEKYTEMAAPSCRK